MPTVLTNCSVHSQQGTNVQKFTIQNPQLLHYYCSVSILYYALHVIHARMYHGLYPLASHDSTSNSQHPTFRERRCLQDPGRVAHHAASTLQYNTVQIIIYNAHKVEKNVESEARNPGNVTTVTGNATLSAQRCRGDARLIYRTSPCQHVTPLLRELHWLQSRQRMSTSNSPSSFSVASMVWRHVT